MNDDGVRDFAIGSTHYSTERGYVRIYSGATRTLIRTLWGQAALARFGNTLAQAGDLDSDGEKDLLVGAPYASTGRVFAYSGATGAYLWDVGAGVAGDRFGLALGGIEDYDGDGIDDLLAGAPNALAQSGKVYVRSGFDGAELDVLTGATSSDRMGDSLAMLDDLDGDAVADVGIGIPGRDLAGLADAGVVELRSGADLSLLSVCKGPAAGAAFGVALSPAGDANADGVPDLVAGADLAGGAGVTQAGSAHVLSCLTLPLHTDDVVLPTSGGRARFALDAGAGHGLRRYVLLASAGGTWPGIDIGATHVPLNGDFVTRYLFKAWTSLMFVRFRGRLNADGRASATFDTLGPLGPAAAGLQVHFAFVLLDPIDYASNAIPIEFLPN